MLRYDRQIKPGLVALYDIRPGNGVGLFLQPRSLHGASLATAYPHLSGKAYSDCPGKHSKVVVFGVCQRRAAETGGSSQCN